jgi:hypothetical protein
VALACLVALVVLAVMFLVGEVIFRLLLAQSWPTQG